MMLAKQIDFRSVADLKASPLQGGLFHDVSDRELEELMADIADHGLDHPIEVLPDGAVIDGHQRLRAIERLGWSKVRVLVRHDLEGDPTAVELRMIEANTHRRQLDPLDRARLARRLMEITRQRRGQPCGDEPGELREVVGKILNCSGRQVQRRLNILNAPMQVQEAVSAGRLGQGPAEKVARLDRQAQEAIARAIRAGGDPRTVVREHLERVLPDRGTAPADVDREFARFLKATARCLERVAGHEAEIRYDPDRHAETAKVWKRALKLIGRFIEGGAAARKQHDADIRRVLRESRKWTGQAGG
jgi:ParB/RepB/Spo0J family partition protein